MSCLVTRLTTVIRASQQSWHARSRRVSATGATLKPRSVMVGAAQAGFSTPLTSIDHIDVDESWSDESQVSMEALVKRFKKADADGNGVIDRIELRGLLQMVDCGDEIVPMSWLTEEDLDRIMAQYDTNRNGVIEFEEFIKMAHDGVLLEGKLNEYREAFMEADKNADGKLGARELFELFQALGRPVSFDQLVRIFEQYDIDGTGTIELPEFLRMFRDKLLDLDQILDYVAMQGQPWVPSSDTATEGPIVQQGMGSDIQSASDLDFVLNSHPHDLVVLMAVVSWCRASREFARDYDALCRHYPNAIFLRLTGNATPSAKELFKHKLKCRATPTFYFFRNGSLLGSWQGVFPAKVEQEVRLHAFPDPLPNTLFPPEREWSMAGMD